MSYSFLFRAASVAVAAAAISACLDEVVAEQPVHAADRAQAEAAAASLLNLLGEPGEGPDLTGAVSGWVAKTGDALTGASVSVSVTHAARLTG
mgnify:CR=1 FL=1